MIDPRNIDELSRRILELLPRGSEQLGEEVRDNVRALLSATLARMDLVTREEFDVQRAVLARSRAKIDALERRLVELEAELVPGGAHRDPPDGD